MTNITDLPHDVLSSGIFTQLRAKDVAHIKQTCKLFRDAVNTDLMLSREQALRQAFYQLRGLHRKYSSALNRENHSDFFVLGIVVLGFFSALSVLYIPLVMQRRDLFLQRRNVSNTFKIISSTFVLGFILSIIFKHRWATATKRMLRHSGLSNLFIQNAENAYELFNNFSFEFNLQNPSQHSNYFDDFIAQSVAHIEKRLEDTNLLEAERKVHPEFLKQKIHADLFGGTPLEATTKAEKMLSKQDSAIGHLYFLLIQALNSLLPPTLTQQVIQSNSSLPTP